MFKTLTSRFTGLAERNRIGALTGCYRQYATGTCSALPLPKKGSEPPRVLVTGANGYIAKWIVQTLLEQGFSVRCTARSEAKVSGLKKLFENAEWQERLDWAVIEDIAKEGAFDQSVQGVQGILHTAAPGFDHSAKDPVDYTRPIVDATTNLLNSALKYGSDLRRIGITSSCVATVTPRTKSRPRIFLETDWADESIEAINKDGAKIPDVLKFRAAKTLAEKTAFGFVEKNKGKISWDVTTLLPSHVIGPNLGTLSSPKELNASLRQFFDYMVEDQPAQFLKASVSPVDVRDVALAHVLSLTKAEAGGERFLISNDAVTWQSLRDKAYDINPTWYEDRRLPRGKSGSSQDIQFGFEHEKSKRILGLSYRPLEESIRDTMTEFEAREWF